MDIKLQKKSTLQLRSGQAPTNPGVYFYKNAHGIILYIGKAGNLRTRLRSYFGVYAPPKAKALVQEAATLSWEIVGSETEALIHEAELIKKYRPQYNVLMRDDKQYFYVGFTHEKYPKIFITHQPETSQIKIGNYLGPFTDGLSLKSTLKTLRRIFPYCTCKSLHTTPCLNAKISRCLGYCCAQQDSKYKWSESPRAYQNNINAIKKVLAGKNKSLVHSLTKEMKIISRARRYEKASYVRDQIKALEQIFKHRGVIKNDMPSDRQRALHALADILKSKEVDRIEGYDISNIQGNFAYGSMVVFENGLPAKSEYRIFKIRSVAGSDDPRMIFETITRRLRHPEWPYPDVMLIDGGPTQLSMALKAKLQSMNFQTKQYTSFFSLLMKEGKNRISDIKIVSLAKREEELFLSPKQKPIIIKESSESLYSLLTHIRNESHRFAISHYRKEHHKKFLKN